MKPLVQINSLPDNNSFIINKVDKHWFETSWHQHTEYELILITEGNGYVYNNRQAIQFEKNDIIFIGSTLPHKYQIDNNQSTNAIVIQFKINCLGNQFLNLPECRDIKQFLETSNNSLQLTNNNNYELQFFIKSFLTAKNVDCIIILLKCLQLMIPSKDFKRKSNNNNFNNIDNEFIQKVFRFIHHHFQDPVSLKKAASVACMSVPTFCNSFKLHTSKTFINYLNEVRMDYACLQLRKTNKSVTIICFESGYNTISHFHRQFLKLKKVTPLQYRKSWIKKKIEINEIIERLIISHKTQNVFTSQYA